MIFLFLFSFWQIFLAYPASWYTEAMLCLPLEQMSAAYLVQWGKPVRSWVAASSVWSRCMSLHHTHPPERNKTKYYSNYNPRLNHIDIIIYFIFKLSYVDNLLTFNLPKGSQSGWICDQEKNCSGKYDSFIKDNNYSFINGISIKRFDQVWGNLAACIRNTYVII